MNSFPHNADYYLRTPPSASLGATDWPPGPMENLPNYEASRTKDLLKALLVSGGPVVWQCNSFDKMMAKEENSRMLLLLRKDITFYLHGRKSMKARKQLWKRA